MKATSLKHISFVFFGSGPVAAASLKLLSETFTIEAVVTKPKPTHHKGEFPTILVAEKLGIPIYTVSKRSELSELIASSPFRNTLAVLIDFGIIVGQDAIDYFSYGIINSHFSVLPEWRGADPISFAVLSGQQKTGVSLMLLDQGMDTGQILTTKSLAIDPLDTTPSLTDKLISLSDDLLSAYIPDYINGDVKPRNQSHPDRATYSRKLTKADGIIDWDKPAVVIEREIRAFVEWPKSRTTFAGKDVIITSAHAVPSTAVDLKPGNINMVEQIKGFGIATSDGTLWVDKLKPAGKNEMTAAAFLAGYGHLLKD